MCDSFRMSAMDVGVIFSDKTLFSDRITGCFDVLTKVIDRFLMVASCGCGHCLLLKASTTTFWSGKLTWILVDSPGIIISLVLIKTSGCFVGGGAVLYCAVPGGVCAVLYSPGLCTGFAGVVL